jgi:hypothetical protein
MVAGAAIVAAWFGLGWVQARDLGRAETLLAAGKVSASQARTVSSLLDTAGTLNPDRTVDITRAQLADTVNNPGLGVRIMEPVTQAEPLNLQAWRELGVVATDNHQRGLAQTAFTHVLRLFGYRH